MTYKEYKNESYNLYTIKTNKFKTVHMEIVFYNKLDKEKITSTNLITDLLTHSSKKYNKRKYVVEKLEDLYNASFYGTASRVGNLRTINFVYNFIDPKYADKNYLKEVIKFPFDMIFEPNIINDEFDLRSFKIIKNRIVADIKSIKESPTRYAIKKGLQYMDDKHPAAIDLTGDLAHLEKITPSSLVDDYKELINNYKCDILIIGNLDMEKINFMVNEYFRNNIIKNDDFDIYIENKKISKVKEKVEHENFAQATLVSIFNTKDLSEYEKNYTMLIFNYIFGNGSLTNKLFMNLRENNSLCYVVNSLYQKYDNLLIVYAGIDEKNKSKAISLIKKSLKEMQSGNFSDSDLENAIKSMVSTYKSASDSQSSLINNYFFNKLVGIPLIKDRMIEILNIKKEDVIRVAKKIELNTNYLMAGDNSERN